MAIVNPSLLPPVGPGGVESFAQYWVETWESQVPRSVQLQHLAQGIASIELKRVPIDLHWRYYHGAHENTILSSELMHLEKHFGVRLATMFTNYCALLVDAPLSRLTVSGWKGPAVHVKRAVALWDENALELEAEEVHRHAMVGGEAFVIVWPTTDENGLRVPGKYDITLQDERTMHMVYKSMRRNDPLCAVKVWQDDDKWRAILYYENEIVRLVTPEMGENPQCPKDLSLFQPDPDDPGGPHDFGQVPVVRFSRTFDGRSKMADAIPIQDRINKLTADKIVAAEYGAFPQRWMLTHDEAPDKLMRAGPGAVWKVAPTSMDPTPGGDRTPARTEIGQFAITELSNYDETIQREVEAFFTLGELPRHLLVSPTAMMTGEAIKADEGPMVAAVRGYIKTYTAAWKQVMQLAGANIDDVTWQSVEVHNEQTQAEVFVALTQGGFPAKLAAQFALDLPQEMLDQLPSSAVLQPGAGTLRIGSGAQQELSGQVEPTPGNSSANEATDQ